MLVFKETLFYLIIAPKSNGSDAGNLVTPKGSCKVLPLGETLRVLDLIRKEKKIIIC